MCVLVYSQPVCVHPMHALYIFDQGRKIQWFSAAVICFSQESLCVFQMVPKWISDAGNGCGMCGLEDTLVVLPILWPSPCQNDMKVRVVRTEFITMAVYCNKWSLMASLVSGPFGTCTWLPNEEVHNVFQALSPNGSINRLVPISSPFVLAWRKIHGVSGNQLESTGPCWINMFPFFPRNTKYTVNLLMVFERFGKSFLRMPL